MVIDECEITIKAGDGGAGKVSFGKMRKSGPDGGNGGDGGSVILKSSSDLTLLSQFQGKELVAAEDGAPGDRKKMTGKKGKDLIITLPVGTLLRDVDTDEAFELTSLGQEVFLCKGGIGGVGNFDLRSSVNTTPKNTIAPTKGQSRRLKVSLRFIADYGLIGLPSAGKSSLLNELTNAKARTAEYHFTTLSPNLGVLPSKKIIADIPGLIEGAHKGRGLGVKFLKHIEKVKLLIHCVSSDSANPLKDYNIVRDELANYKKSLLRKREIILLTKSDLASDSDVKTKVKNFSGLGKKVLPVSIYDTSSLQELIKEL